MTKKTVEEATTGKLAAWLDCDPRTLSTYARQGHAIRLSRGKFDLKKSIIGVVKHLRAQASGRGGDAQNTLAKERAALARAQRETLELKSRALREEYVFAADVSRAMVSMCVTVRNRLLSVPSNLPLELPHLTRADLDVIDRAIRDALVDLANHYDAEDAKREKAA